MEELKINQEVGKLLNHLCSQNLKPEEKIAVLHSAIAVVEQTRLQQVILESLSRAFAPIERKTIN